MATTAAATEQLLLLNAVKIHMMKIPQISLNDMGMIIVMIIMLKQVMQDNCAEHYHPGGWTH